MAAGLHSIVETPEFARSAASVLTESERTALIVFLASDPLAGEVMQGTGGARKLRWGAKGKGKSGGARVITFYAGLDMPLFLLAIFGKNEKANLSKSERNELRELLADIVRVYRRE